jgi:hypothetical protein
MNIYPCCEHCSPEPGSGEHEHSDPCFYGCDDNVEWSSEDSLTDVEADAMTLASAGWGTDEDYGYYGGDDY